MNKRSYLSAAVLALVMAGASAPSIMDQYLLEKESSGVTPLKAYQDGARIWTVCDGKTEGVTRSWAGVGSWCFNVGNTGCAKATTVKLINQGQQAAGCKAILRWRFITRDGKKVDCSTKQPYCPGLWDRRNGEAELCAL